MALVGHASGAPGTAAVVRKVLWEMVMVPLVRGAGAGAPCTAMALKPLPGKRSALVPQFSNRLSRIWTLVSAPAGTVAPAPWPVGLTMMLTLRLLTCCT